MINRNLPSNPTLIDRFGWLLYWLFEGLALDWRRRGLRHVHQGEIHQRILGLWKRLRSVLERHRAGTLRAATGRDTSARPSPQSAEGEGRAAGAQRMVPGWSVLPRTFGWLKSLLLPDRQYHVTAFNLLLHDNAEIQAVIAAAPAQIGRVLRPFCHFLGLEVPAELRLPKRRRRPGLRRHAAAASRLRDDAAEMIVPNRRLPAREQAEDAIRRSEASGKPIDVRGFTAEANGWFLHPPRDGNCPPPKIGYAGRRRRPPKDYRPPRDE
jgi:hypothetical protein